MITVQWPASGCMSMDTSVLTCLRTFGCGNLMIRVGDGLSWVGVIIWQKYSKWVGPNAQAFTSLCSPASCHKQMNRATRGRGRGRSWSASGARPHPTRFQSYTDIRVVAGRADLEWVGFPHQVWSGKRLSAHSPAFRIMGWLCWLSSKASKIFHVSP